MNKRILLNLALLIVVSLVLALIIFFVNLWLFSSHPEFTSEEISFLEGIVLIPSGILFLLGSGGINRASSAAALLAAATEAITGSKTVGPSEVYRRDAWKPRGFTRFGLVLIITGIILLIICFISVSF
ncbi:hypothetical protein HXY32_01520 [Candidatus Bathyarchaeota archaeon]|nr:hypothetical protein [Candidatus Bathyarchaeota archaeon]